MATFTTFADEKKRNPTRVELRDNDDQMQMAADYEYEFDECGNWPKGSVWTWTPRVRRAVIARD